MWSTSRAGKGRRDLDNADGGLLVVRWAGWCASSLRVVSGSRRFARSRALPASTGSRPAAARGEAFISGAPQKKERSLAIWREVGRRLLGSFSATDVVQGFADGGISEPSWNGQSLSYWADQLKSPLEYTQLLITIRDLKAELAEKHKSGKSKGKYKLTGLDRTEAQQRLAEAEADKKLADEAAKLNGSSAGVD